MSRGRRSHWSPARRSSVGLLGRLNSSVGSWSGEGCIPGVTAPLVQQENSIRVAARARPLNNQELREGQNVVWRCTGNFVEELEDNGFTPTGKTHEYDNVFGPETSNAEIYEVQCRNIVQRALEGYNGTIFAYGQTASGKTHTLMGDPKANPGVTLRAIGDIFDVIAANGRDAYSVHVAYMEIYNENITDLLESDSRKGRNLKIVEDKVFGPTVKGLTELRALNQRHCFDVFLEGERRRAQAATVANDTSSRSHTLFRMRIECRVIDGNAHEEETKQNMRVVASTLMKAQRDLSAAHASLYLVDPDLDELYIHSGDSAMRLPMSRGIAGACVAAAEVINIPNAHEDQRFSPRVDRKTGYHTRSILCMPILGSEGSVIGVAQFVNKTHPATGACVRFDAEDERRASEVMRSIAPLILLAQRHAQTSFLSRLNLVDLAGSERQRKTASKAIIREGGHINTSLLMLGTCIALLSEGREQHIPYRNSKLTQMLSTSLGGNTNTCMICAFSPASGNRFETVSTLQFGSRARKVVNCVRRNCWRDQSELVELYGAEIERLRAQLQEATAGRGLPGEFNLASKSFRLSMLNRDRSPSPPAPAKWAQLDGASVSYSGELTDRFVGRLRSLEREALEAQALANANSPADAPPLQLVVKVISRHASSASCETSSAAAPAAPAAPGGGAELVVAAFRGFESKSAEGLGAELLSEEEFHVRLRWLRSCESRRKAQADADDARASWSAGARGSEDAWAMAAAATVTKRWPQLGQVVSLLDGFVRGAAVGAREASISPRSVSALTVAPQRAPESASAAAGAVASTAAPETSAKAWLREQVGELSQLQELLQAQERQQREMESLRAVLEARNSEIASLRAALAASSGSVAGAFGSSPAAAGALTPRATRHSVVVPASVAPAWRPSTPPPRTAVATPVPTAWRPSTPPPRSAAATPVSSARCAPQPASAGLAMTPPTPLAATYKPGTTAATAVPISRATAFGNALSSNRDFHSPQVIGGGGGLWPGR